MEYMESKMQDQIEGGISENERLHAELSRLRELVKEMLEALDEAIESGETAGSEYDGQSFTYCTSCGEHNLTHSVIEHAESCGWKKARMIIAKADAILKESGHE